MSEFNEFDQQGSVPNKETGSIISHAFEMYKGVFGYAIVAMIVYIVGGMIIQSITGFNSAAIVEEMQSSGDYGSFRYWETPGFSMYMTFSSIFLLLLTPLYVGLIYMVNKFNTKNPIEFSDLFIGYRQNFVNILIYSFLSGLISSVALTLCFLPFIFIYPFLLLGYPILLFENSSAIDALSKSFNIAKENYGTFLGVSFLGLLISMAGIILCGIGIILTAPFIMVVMYSAYCAFVGKPRQIMYTK
ncbi:MULTISPECIES: beta-carotene 15,15'-monooxygenase [Chryseobacterium]|uniref:Beta-carotene 15,15'-monooxygenase n=1 Tax=Chryseobacterium bernardetii TaxID=1241978 RepID=A0A3G6U7C7_9FLAO|nr:MULTISPECIES: beta-carotene 15,15'-monooxygenase [Chryseobacterium]AZB24009.1 beta-carotene 15,15'-monooxygenase [Chryseobacterium bernardetii]AZB34594.1 beta-carotene 15,15'-monooxygenase [Chryseobacterium bernardetii]UCA58297.1 beta-carotene 15,15'-monooxygenase [Chryseobacterium rhizoplanae]